MISTKSDRIETAPESAPTLLRGLTNSLDRSKERLMPNSSRTCSIPGCVRERHYAYGPCRTHHRRFQKYGSYGKPAVKKIPAIDRFLEKVNKNGPLPTFLPELGKCWIWEAALSGGGNRYGLFYDGAKGTFAHRFAWEYYRGSIPNGLTIDHLCRTTTCVNPNHLEPVTQAENNLRATRLITHCPYGHGYTEENTYTHKGSRVCKKCRRRRVAAAVAKRRRRDKEKGA